MYTGLVDEHDQGEVVARGGSDDVSEQEPGAEQGKGRSPRLDQRLTELVDESGQVAADLIAQLPVGIGYYFHVSKRSTVGSPPEFLADLEVNEQIDNFESYLQRVAYEREWGSGEYVVRCRLRGEGPGKKGSRPFVVKIRVPDQPATAVSIPPVVLPKSSVEYFDELAKISESMKRAIAPLLPPSAQPVNVSEIVATVVGAIKSTMAAQPTVDMKSQLAEVIAIVRQLQPKESSLLEQLQAFKQLGLIPDGRGEPPDEMAQLEKMAKMAQIFQSMSGGSSGGKTSAVAEVLKALSPHIGEGLGAIKELIVTIREAKGLRSVRPTTVATVPSQTTGLAGQTSLTEPAVPDHPFLKELYAAVEKGGQDFYPRLVHGIGYHLENGDQYLAAMVDGVMSEEQAQQFLVDIGGEYFRQGKVKEYLAGFVTWYRAYLGRSEPTPLPEDGQPATDELRQGELLVAVCQRCQSEYEFLPKEWAEEPDPKLCDCQGELVLATPVGATPEVML